MKIQKIYKRKSPFTYILTRAPMGYVFRLTRSPGGEGQVLSLSLAFKRVAVARRQPKAFNGYF